MARKKQPEEHENHERWLVSYADFITLLFAFFVVMYSMSSVNEGKYRVLSDSMSAAFRPTSRSLNPIQIGELVRAMPDQFPVIIETPRRPQIIPLIPGIRPELVIVEEVTEDSIEGLSNVDGEDSGQLQSLGNELADILDTLIEEQDIEVRENDLWLEVEISSNILFPSGSADLSLEAMDILTTIGNLLSGYPNPITVEGFTDNQPIRNSIFPSNWELSSARAASVVRLFDSAGVNPGRMSSVGYGEFRPKTDNDSEDGRARNRRVVIIIMAAVNEQEHDLLFSELETLRRSGALQ